MKPPLRQGWHQVVCTVYSGVQAVANLCTLLLNWFQTGPNKVCANISNVTFKYHGYRS